MTTIAYRAGIMAADGRVTAGDLIKSDTDQKIHLIEHRGLVAACGQSACIERFLGWMRSSQSYDEKPYSDVKVEEGFFAIEARYDGEVWLWDEGLRAYQQPQEYYALGNGFEIAWGAMLMGATAEQAVIAAAKANVYTGGKIQVEALANHFPAAEAA